MHLVAGANGAAARVERGIKMQDATIMRACAYEGDENDTRILVLAGGPVRPTYAHVFDLNDVFRNEDARDAAECLLQALCADMQPVAEWPDNEFDDLITARTLDGWLSTGYVPAPDGYWRMVVAGEGEGLVASDKTVSITTLQTAYSRTGVAAYAAIR